MAQHSGWYEDPFNPDQLRYWDGILWTSRTTPKAPPSAPPPALTPPQDAQAPAASGYPPAPGQPYGQPGQPGQPYGQPGQYGPGAPLPTRYDQPAGYIPPHWQSSPWAQSGPVAPDGTPLAAWWQRLIARIIDNIVASVLTLVFAWPWVSDIVDAFRRFTEWVVANPQADQSAFDAQTRIFTDQILSVLVPYVLISIAVRLVYEVGFLAAAGATPGKFFLGTRVRAMDRPGPPTLLEALRRQVIWVGTTAFSVVPVIGFFAGIFGLLDDAWLLWDARRQCLHDKVAGTIVVKNI